MYIDIVVLFMTSDQIDSRDLWPKKGPFLSFSPSQYAELEREAVTNWAGWHNTGCGRSQI